ncbi:hypothetical protein ACB092_03G044400 [Castanea dentata]
MRSRPLLGASRASHVSATSLQFKLLLLSLLFTLSIHRGQLISPLHLSLISLMSIQFLVTKSNCPRQCAFEGHLFSSWDTYCKY